MPAAIGTRRALGNGAEQASRSLLHSGSIQNGYQPSIHCPSPLAAVLGAGSLGVHPSLRQSGNPHRSVPAVHRRAVSAAPARMNVADSASKDAIGHFLEGDKDLLAPHHHRSPRRYTGDQRGNATHRENRSWWWRLVKPSDDDENPGPKTARCCISPCRTSTPCRALSGAAEAQDGRASGSFEGGAMDVLGQLASASCHRPAVTWTTLALSIAGASANARIWTMLAADRTLLCVSIVIGAGNVNEVQRLRRNISHAQPSAEWAPSAIAAIRT